MRNRVLNQSVRRRLPRTTPFLTPRLHAIAGMAVLSLVMGCGGGSSDQIFSVGIPTDRMVEVAAEQQGQNWCWAACVQMVLSTKGIKVTQADVVQRTYGAVVDAPGGADAILSRLSGWFQTRSGKTLLAASVVQGPMQEGLLYSYLKNQSPLILGVNYPGASIGHAVVVTAAVFKVSDAGLELKEVVVRDPWPDLAAQKGKRKLTREEFANAMFYCVVDVVKKP
jgi:hypothetical protein